MIEALLNLAIIIALSKWGSSSNRTKNRFKALLAYQNSKTAPVIVFSASFDPPIEVGSIDRV